MRLSWRNCNKLSSDLWWKYFQIVRTSEPSSVWPFDKFLCCNSGWFFKNRCSLTERHYPKYVVESSTIGSSRALVFHEEISKLFFIARCLSTMHVHIPTNVYPLSDWQQEAPFSDQKCQWATSLNETFWIQNDWNISPQFINSYLEHGCTQNCFFCKRQRYWERYSSVAKRNNHAASKQKETKNTPPWFSFSFFFFKRQGASKHLASRSLSFLCCWRCSDCCGLFLEMVGILAIFSNKQIHYAFLHYIRLC